jgi:hypothetical protein
MRESFTNPVPNLLATAAVSVHNGNVQMKGVFAKYRGVYPLVLLAGVLACSATYAQPRIQAAKPGVWSRLTRAEVQTVRVLGDYAYVVDGYGGLEVIDVSVPANPVLVGNYFNGDWLRGFELVGTNAAAIIPNFGLAILDLSNPANPQLIGQLTNNDALFYDLQVAGSHAFAAGYYGLQIIDLSSPTNPVVVGSWGDLPTSYAQAEQVQVVGHIAYVTVDTDPGSTGGILQAVIDVSDPAHPVFLKYLGNINSYLNEMRESGHYLLTVDFNPFLNVYDNSDPTNITLVANFPTRSSTFGLTIVGNYAYVPEAQIGAVQVFDISNPTNIVEVGVFDAHGPCESLFVANNLVYVANWDQGLAIIPSAPHFQFTVQIDATPGVPFTIESATDLGLPQPWSPLVTTNSNRMPLWFTDRDVAAGSKFYRVRQP